MASFFPEILNQIWQEISLVWTQNQKQIYCPVKVHYYIENCKTANSVGFQWVAVLTL